MAPHSLSFRGSACPLTPVQPHWSGRCPTQDSKSWKLGEDSPRLYWLRGVDMGYPFLHCTPMSGEEEE